MMPSVPGVPSPAGGALVPVCCVQVPELSGFNSQSWPALNSKKFPVHGSAQRLPAATPKDLPKDTFASEVFVRSEFRRQMAFGLELPPPYTATFLAKLYSRIEWYVAPLLLGSLNGA